MTRSLRRRIVLIVAAGMLMTGGVRAAEKQPRQVSDAQFLGHAERVLKEVTALRGSPDAIYGGYFDIRELRDELLKRAGRSDAPDRIHMALGRCALLLADYRAAVAEFETALRLSPSSVDAAASLQGAREPAAVADVVRPHLWAGNEIVQITNLSPRGAPAVWAVLSAKWLRPSHKPDAWADTFSDVHLTVVASLGGALRVLWQSQTLPAEHSAVGQFHEVPLFLVHQRGSSAPQLALAQNWHGVSRLPSHLSLFVWDGSQLRKVFGANGDEPLWIKDLNRDGRFEIGDTYGIGRSLSHAEMPRWTDIYAWNGRAYVPANRKMPRKFRGVARQLRTALRDHPEDFELLKYQGILDEIQHRPRAALRHFRLAGRACRAELSRNDNPGSRVSCKLELADIRNRLARVKTPRGSTP
jgi:hypothetical protein